MVRSIIVNVLVADSQKSRIRCNCNKAAGNLNEMTTKFSGEIESCSVKFDLKFRAKGISKTEKYLHWKM